MRKYFVSGLAHIAQFTWNPTEKLWNRNTVAGTSLGAAGAMTLLGQLFGVSAVLHSSGAMILTGSGGYIAGTYIVGALVWFIWPILVLIGVLALTWRWVRKIPDFAVVVLDKSVRQLYKWRNRP